MITTTIQLSTRFIHSLLGVALLATTASCSLQGASQVATAHHEPEFRVRAVEEASLNGLNVLPLHVPADIDLVRRNQVISGYVNKQLPLRVRVQLNAYNPSSTPATITGVSYTVMVDGRALGTGRQATALQVPAGDSVRVPLTFEFNTYKFLGEDALPALRNFALGFGDLHRQRVVVQVRPLLRTPKGHLSSPISRADLAYDETAVTKVAAKSN